MPPCCITAERVWSKFTMREEGRCAGLHCYGTLSGQRDSANNKHLFFLDVGRMPAASQESVHVKLVAYKATFK